MGQDNGVTKKNNGNIIDAIRRHSLFQEYYKRLELAEHDRKFCRHQMNHLLDVARIAYIQNLEQELGFSKEMIYAAALLHDIGKARQYEEGIPHEIASAEIAEIILKDVSLKINNSFSDREENTANIQFFLDTKENAGYCKAFSLEDRKEILCAIREHRKYREDMSALGRLLYASDKKSRQCFACPVDSECNWTIEKKNMEIEI